MSKTLEVALSLYRVNRAASAMCMQTKGLIYRYKTGTLRRLSIEERVAWAVEEIRHPCWHTERYNLGLETPCSRCGGSGIFRVEYQVRFHLSVEERDFYFHQPIAQVDWFDVLENRPVEIEQITSEEFIRDRGFFVDDMRRLRFYSGSSDPYQQQEIDRRSLSQWYGWKGKTHDKEN